MNSTIQSCHCARLVCAVLSIFSVNATWAIDVSIPYVGGDQSRTLLGDGTGVIIGIIDTGVDETHPALSGLDSVGNPRLVAEGNFVTDEPGNTGEDVIGHGTAMASVALSANAFYTGMAPDARYVNARVFTSTGEFSIESDARNGIIFAIDNGADVLSLPWNYNALNNSGQSPLDLLIDWAAYERGISTAVTVGNVSQSVSGSPRVRGPGSAFNVVTVGRTISDFSQVHPDSSVAYTGDGGGRMKPDLVAPGSNLTVANIDNFGIPELEWIYGWSGVSFAESHVAGMMAQMIEAGRTLGYSTDPLVIKATMMNTAEKVLDKDGNPWEQASVVNNPGVLSALRPLDDQSGAGQINGAKLAEQYLAGPMTPGTVEAIGWGMESVSDDEYLDYVIDLPLMTGSTFSATLTWYRHVVRTDNGNGIVDIGDQFQVFDFLSDLNLQLLRDGNVIAESVSLYDNVEHLYLEIDQQAQYTLRVFHVPGFFLPDGPELFALAWHSVAVPEPASVALLALGGVTLLRTRRIRLR